MGLQAFAESDRPSKSDSLATHSDFILSCVPLADPNALDSCQRSLLIHNGMFKKVAKLMKQKDNQIRNLKARVEAQQKIMRDQNIKIKKFQKLNNQSQIIRKQNKEAKVSQIIRKQNKGWFKSPDKQDQIIEEQRKTISALMTQAKRHGIRQ